MFFKIGLLQNRPDGLQLYHKETSTSVFSCEICKIFNNTIFTEHLQWLLLVLDDPIKKTLISAKFLKDKIVRSHTGMNCKKFNLEVDTRRCSVKNIFLKISRISQKNNFARASFLIKSQELYLKRDSDTGVFL